MEQGHRAGAWHRATQAAAADHKTKLRGRKTNPRTEGRADCYWRNGVGFTKWENLPRYSAEIVRSVIEWWTTDACKYTVPAQEQPQEPPMKRRGLFARLFGKTA